MMDQLLGLNLTIVLLVLVFNFVFDLVDLGCEKDIKSFTFIFSVTYAIYFTLRAFFGLAAAFVTESTGILENPLLISLFSVVGSVSILQNFSLNIAGMNGIDIHDFFKDYKTRIIADVFQRERKTLENRKCQTEEKLARLSIKKLKRILTLTIAGTMRREEWKRVQQEHLEYVESVSEGDKEIQKLLLARIIASLDPFGQSIPENAK